MNIDPIESTPRRPITPNGPAQEQMMEVAKKLEAAFLAEMLKSAGVGETPSAFGGGSGEDQFASFLREEHARQMANVGGVGLAQSLFEHMVERSNV